MALAQDSSVSVSDWSGSNPVSANITTTDNDTVLFVSIMTNGAVTALSVTHNGTPMKQLYFETDAGSNKHGFFYLENPDAGTNSISITRTGGANIAAVAASYTGVNTECPIDGSSYSTGSNTAVATYTTNAFNVSNANNWVVSGLRLDNTSFTSTELTLLINSTTVFEAIYDSNGTWGTTGSDNVTYNVSPSARLWGITALSLPVNPGATLSAVDDFEDHSTGNLNGQSGGLGWSTDWSGSTLFQVSTADSPYEGTQHVKATPTIDAFQAISRTFTATGTTLIKCAVKINRTGGTSGKAIRGDINIYDGTTQVGRLFIYVSNTATAAQILTTSPWEILPGTVTNNTYHVFYIEYDSTNNANKYRARFDDNAWTPWSQYNGSPTWSTINKIEFDVSNQDAGAAGSMYWDILGDPYYVGGTDYPLTASAGSFTLTGNATAFQKAWKMAAAVGSFTLTGIAVAFNIGKGYIMTAAAGVFNLTGNNATFSKAVTMIAAAGSFTLTGVAATLNKGKTMAVTAGSFVVSFLTTNLLQKPWGRTGRNTGIWTRSSKNDDE